MKNKKGFTLVELLAVIAILAILAGLATPIVLTVQNNIKKKMFDAKVKEIKAAGVLYAEKNNLTGTSYKRVGNLCEGNFLTVEKDYGTDVSQCIKNPKNDRPMGQCKIKIEKESNGRYTVTLTGESYLGSSYNIACQ